MRENDVDAPANSPVIDIHSLLFRSKSGKEARPFDNIPDLGRAIAAIPNSRHAGKEGTVTSFLRQVFNGTRPCPNEYLKAVVTATRMRIEERHLPGNPESIIADLEKYVQALKKRRVREKHRQKTAKPLGDAQVRFAVNPPLGDLRMSSSEYTRISSLVAQSLAPAEENRLPQTTYKICYPLETDAVDLWRMIFNELTVKRGNDEVTGGLDPETASDIMQRADASNHLQIYVVPYYLCLASALIDNPDSRDDCTGVMLQLEKEGRVKSYEIRERTITYWRQMYYDIENGVFGEYRRLEFSKYRKLVMKLPTAF